MNKLEKKREEFAKLRMELMEMEEAEKMANKYPSAKKLEGTYQKYRNCYSCPEKPSDYWYIYRRINLVKADGTMIVDRFQIDKYGDVRLETGKEENWGYSNQSDWLPSSEGEFHEEALKVKAKLLKLID